MDSLIQVPVGGGSQQFLSLRTNAVLVVLLMGCDNIVRQNGNKYWKAWSGHIMRLILKVFIKNSPDQRKRYVGDPYLDQIHWQSKTVGTEINITILRLSYDSYYWTITESTKLLCYNWE